MLSIPEEYSGRVTVTLAEAASMLGIKVKTLYNQISAGICPIPSTRLGGRRLIKVNDLIKIIESDAVLNTPVASCKSKKNGVRRG